MDDVDLVATLLMRAGITATPEELAVLADAMATLKERVDRQYAVPAGLDRDGGPQRAPCIVILPCGFDIAIGPPSTGPSVRSFSLLRYGVTDIRLLYENDVRFLEQL